jgi:hypothetical protein
MKDDCKRVPRNTILTLAASLLLGGCTALGPASVQRDRVEYLSTIADSWKEQTLLNIVRLRYSDAPVFLDVSSLISSYSMESQAGSTFGIFPHTTGDNVSLGATGKYTDRPTITYSPVTGEKFAKNLLQPIPPVSVFALLQAGYPAEVVMKVTVRAINGVYNQSSAGARARNADPAAPGGGFRASLSGHPCGPRPAVAAFLRRQVPRHLVLAG